MKPTWDEALGRIARQIGKITKVKIDASEFVLAPKPELGDIALACFRFAGKKEKNRRRSQKISPSRFRILTALQRRRQPGPYLNITLKITEMLPRLLKEAKNNADAFGETDSLKKQTILLNTQIQTRIRKFTSGTFAILFLAHRSSICFVAPAPESSPLVT